MFDLKEDPKQFRLAFENAIRFYPLELCFLRESEVELHPFPPMVRTYLGMANPPNGMPPRQQEFTNAVVSQMNQDFLSLRRRGVEARISRTYCAMVQQHHAMLTLVEKFGNCIWDERMDTKYGIDLASNVMGQWFGFTVSVQTERSNEQKTRKSHNYKSPPVPVLDLKIQPNKYTRGRFWLYDVNSGEVEAFVAREQAS